MHKVLKDLISSTAKTGATPVFCCLVKRFCGLPRYDRLRTLTRWPLLLLSTSHFPQIYGARKGHPQTAYQADFSVRIAHRNPEGTSTSTISSGILCSNSSSEPERDSYKHHIKWNSLFELSVGARKGHPQTAYQADFSVRIARRNPEGTSTSTIPSGFLCLNSPSEPERAMGDRFHGLPD